jgi:His/Glu/Gln/Arg/opine family amino acid ABC transporter permease subunit
MEGGFRADLILDGGWLLLGGLGVAVGVALAAMVVAMVLGLVVAALRQAPSPWLWVPAFAYIQVFRGTSLYVFILWVYFGLAMATGVALPAVGAAVLCLGMLHSAYMAEIYRAGLSAVSRGQYDAARALGLSWVHIYRDVVAPQALAVIVPAAANLFVDVLKDSALVGVVGVNDVMRVADRLTRFYFRPFEFFTAATGLYVATVLLVSSVVVRRLDARFAPR